MKKEVTITITFRPDKGSSYHLVITHPSNPKVFIWASLFATREQIIGKLEGYIALAVVSFERKLSQGMN